MLQPIVRTQEACLDHCALLARQLRAQVRTGLLSQDEYEEAVIQIYNLERMVEQP